MQRLPDAWFSIMLICDQGAIRDGGDNFHGSQAAPHVVAEGSLARSNDECNRSLCSECEPPAMEQRSREIRADSMALRSRLTRD